MFPQILGNLFENAIKRVYKVEMRGIPITLIAGVVDFNMAATHGLIFSLNIQSIRNLLSMQNNYPLV